MPQYCIPWYGNLYLLRIHLLVKSQAVNQFLSFIVKSPVKCNNICNAPQYIAHTHTQDTNDNMCNVHHNGITILDKFLLIFTQ